MNSSCALVVPRFFALREDMSSISGSSLIPFVLFSRSCNAAFSYCHEQIKNLQYEYCRFLWQGRKASNPGPTVLETVALPAELHPYINYLHPHLSFFSPSSEESPTHRFPRIKEDGKSGYELSAKPEAELSEFHLTCWWAFRDSNPGPTGYEPAALTN